MRILPPPVTSVGQGGSTLDVALSAIASIIASKASTSRRCRSRAGDTSHVCQKDKRNQCGDSLVCAKAAL